MNTHTHTHTHTHARTHAMETGKGIKQKRADKKTRMRAERKKGNNINQKGKKIERPEHAPA